jgi:serine/threonine-protein kinase
MSPEQAMGATDQIDERSDVYSLAVMLYELLSLQHYLPGRTTVAALLAAIVDEPHVMAAFVGSPHQPPVPAELSWFIEKGLAKDPDARFQSVAEMGAQLERVMAGAFPVQCPVTFIKKAGGNTLRYFDRHPALMIGATLVAVSLVVLGLVDLLARLLR